MAAPKVTNVVFQLLETPSALGEQVRMVIESDRPLARAIRLRVRVGDQEARVGPFRLTDGARNVYLKEEPAEGAVVHVGWADGRDLTPTSFVYHRPPNA